MQIRWMRALCTLWLIGLGGCVPAGGESGGESDVDVRDVGGVLGGEDAVRPLPVEDIGPGDADADPSLDAGISDQSPVEPDADPGPGDPDCAILAACLQACDNAECSRACSARAPMESRDRYNAIFTCARDQGCTEPGAPPNRACMEERCAEVELACYGEGELPPVGDLDCPRLRACAEACAPADDACRDACEASATPAAATDYAAVARCRLTSGCPPADVLCFEDACAAELATCNGRPVDPEGDPDCDALAACVNECEGVQACADACIAAAPAGARQIYQAAIACLQAAAAQCPEGDVECTNDLCQREVQACVGQATAPGGDGTCAEFDDCLGLCGGERACTDACIAEASPAAYDAYLELVECVQMSCPEGSQPSCGIVSCEPVFEACLGPIGVPRGNLTCLEFNDCLGTCVDGDQPCVNRCIDTASARGYDLFLNAINCIQDAGCAAGDAACQDANCGAQVQACFNDF